VIDALSRGFSGRLLRLYRYEQNYLHRRGGPAPEPAYLLLSSKQGGFPRTGFYLGDEAKPQAGFVDLHRNKRLSGQFGSMDQIFPHELAHLFLFQTSGPPGHGGSNQIHAVGVRTDPMEALSEGFAEHCQALAVDDPDADPATRALANDPMWRKYASNSLALYSKEMAARWVRPLRWQLTFPGWFSQTDQILRYHAVRTNAFAREPEIPEKLLRGPDPYAAYLLVNVLPGVPGGRPKNAARMLATEGVVSALFYRWTQWAALRDAYRDEAFYAQFDVSRANVSPLENVYLKLIHVLAERKPRTTAELITGYKSVFPDEAAAIDAVASDVLLGQALPAYPEIWLANPDFKTGSSLFDQFRAQPRTHTFDLNAASLVDLIGVPGVDRSLAGAILGAGPYQTLDDLRLVSGMTPALLERFRAMNAEMKRFLASQSEDELNGLSPSAILWSYGWRALACIALAALLGAVLFRAIRLASRARAGAAALAATIIALGFGWPIGGSAWTALAAVTALLALPAAIWTAWRRRDLRSTGAVFAAWVAAALPAALLAWPW